MAEITDHDLLIELRTEMQNVRSDIRELKDGTSIRIADLENDKADRREVEELQNKVNKDMEIRMRKLENKTNNYAITMTLYSIAVGTFIGLTIYHLLQ